MRFRSVLLVTLAGALALVLYLISPKPTPRTSSSQNAVVGTSRAKPSKSEVPANRPVSEGGGEPVSPIRDPAGTDQEQRAALLDALVQARAARETPAFADKATRGSEQLEPLAIANKTGTTSDWEERQLATLNDLLGECHALASEEAGGLVGTIGIRFTIAAEPELGGLLDEVEFMEGYSTIENAMMRECMSESMYALELDPPPEGMKVGREVTLRFDDED